MSEYRQDSDERFADIVNEEWRGDERPTRIDQLDPTLRVVLTASNELEQYANSGKCDEFDEELEKKLDDINQQWIQIQALQGRASVSARAYRTDSNDSSDPEIEAVWLEKEALEQSSFLLLCDDDTTYSMYLECILQDTDEPWSYMVKVADINYIDTEYPSQKAGVEHLHYAYPALIESIDAALSPGTHNDLVLLSALQNLEIDFLDDPRPTATHSRQTIVEWLSAYASERIQFDAELYQLEVQGVLKKMVQGEAVEHFLATPRSTMARIDKVIFVNDREVDAKNDHNSYRPYLELHVPEVARSTMAEVYYVPATTVKNIVSLRNTTALVED